MAYIGGGHGIDDTVSLDRLCGVEGAQTVAAHMVRHIWSSSNLHDHAHLREGTALLVTQTNPPDTLKCMLLHWTALLSHTEECSRER